MPPRRSAAEDNWSRFDLRCHGSFMSKRELWHFFSSFVIAAKLWVRRRESVPPTHLGGLPTQLSVTLIKSSVTLNGACSAANLAFVEVSGGSDSRHIMQNKETNKTLFALKNALQRYRLDFMAWHKMSFTAIPNGTGLGHFQGLTPRLHSCSWREIPFNYAKNKNKNNAKYIL